jgi:hypothetical protein
VSSKREDFDTVRTDVADMLAPPSSRRRVLLPGRKRAVRTRAPRPRTVQPKTLKVYVPSPTVPGAREEVRKRVDTIEHMWRAGQIGDRQYKAA